MEHKCVPKTEGRGSAAGSIDGLDLHQQKEGLKVDSRKNIPEEKMPAGWNWPPLFCEGDMFGGLGAGLGDRPFFWTLLPFTI